LARSITISATCTWRAAGSSKVEEITSPFTERCNFGHFFGTLVDQQHDQVPVGIVGRDGMRDVLHHHGLAALGRCDDECALAASDGRDDVDQAAGDVLFGLEVAFQAHLLLGEQRRQVLEHHLVLVGFGRVAVDLVELGEREVAFAILRRAHFAFDHVAGVQVEAADLAGRDVDVVRAGREAGVRAAQKAEAVGKHLEHAVGEHLFARTRTLFDDGKHQLLLAHAASVFDLKGFCLLEDFRHVLCLEFVQMHRVRSWRKDLTDQVGGEGGYRRRARFVSGVWGRIAAMQPVHQLAGSWALKI